MKKMAIRNHIERAIGEAVAAYAESAHAGGDRAEFVVVLEAQSVINEIKGRKPSLWETWWKKGGVR